MLERQSGKELKVKICLMQTDAQSTRKRSIKSSKLAMTGECLDIEHKTIDIIGDR